MTMRGHPQHGVFVDARIPDLQISHPAILAYPPLIVRRRRLSRRRRVRLIQPELAGGNDEAGGQAFDVPLPRPAQRLVEVVDVEEQIALGTCKNAEVHRLSAAASLNPEPRARRGGQIPSHYRWAAAKIGERRTEHPPKTNRQQMRQS